MSNKVVDGREVDFVLLEDAKPVAMIECKWADEPVGRGLHYLKARWPECPAWQISAAGKYDYVAPRGIRVCPALVYLNTLI